MRSTRIWKKIFRSDSRSRVLLMASQDLLNFDYDSNPELESLPSDPSQTFSNAPTASATPISSSTSSVTDRKMSRTMIDESSKSVEVKLNEAMLVDSQLEFDDSFELRRAMEKKGYLEALKEEYESKGAEWYKMRKNYYKYQVFSLKRDLKSSEGRYNKLSDKYYNLKDKFAKLEQMYKFLMRSQASIVSLSNQFPQVQSNSNNSLILSQQDKPSYIKADDYVDYTNIPKSTRSVKSSKRHSGMSRRDSEIIRRQRERFQQDQALRLYTSRVGQTPSVPRPKAKSSPVALQSLTDHGYGSWNSRFQMNSRLQYHPEQQGHKEKFQYDTEHSCFLQDIDHYPQRIPSQSSMANRQRETAHRVEMETAGVNETARLPSKASMSTNRPDEPTPRRAHRIQLGCSHYEQKLNYNMRQTSQSNRIHPPTERLSHVERIHKYLSGIPQDGQYSPVPDVRYDDLRSLGCRKVKLNPRIEQALSCTIANMSLSSNEEDTTLIAPQTTVLQD